MLSYITWVNSMDGANIQVGTGNIICHLLLKGICLCVDMSEGSQLSARRRSEFESPAK